MQIFVASRPFFGLNIVDDCRYHVLTTRVNAYELGAGRNQFTTAMGGNLTIVNNATTGQLSLYVAILK